MHSQTTPRLVLVRSVEVIYGLLLRRIAKALSVGNEPLSEEFKSFARQSFASYSRETHGTPESLTRQYFVGDGVTRSLLSHHLFRPVLPELFFRGLAYEIAHAIAMAWKEEDALDRESYVQNEMKHIAREVS